jgi:hypothetical protein
MTLLLVRGEREERLIAAKPALFMFGPRGALPDASRPAGSDERFSHRRARVMIVAHALRADDGVRAWIRAGRRGEWTSS